jgi:hypothetical protein
LIGFGLVLASCEDNVMSEGTFGLDETEEAALSCEISDEALETAAETPTDKAGNFTLAFCSGVSTCPA